MRNDTCIIFYHGCNWTDIPGRQQYLMRQLGRHLPIIFLDGGADRRLRVTIHRPQTNVTVVRGLTSICQRLAQRHLNPLATVFANWKLETVVQKFSRVIFWASENWLRPYRFIRYDKLIYDCIDPCFSEEPRRIEIFQRRDIEVMNRADHVFATADTLADFCRLHHDRVTLLNNACEPADYAPKLLNSAAKPTWWPQTSKPIAAYLGSLDWRFDFAAVETACRDHPDVHFVLAGNPLPELANRVRHLSALPNVTCPGRISLEDGRFLLKHCTITLIPFTTGPMNDAINPVKMYVYAMLGKPMAGTAVHELTGRPQLVATSGGNFSSAVGAALCASRRPETAAQLQQFAAANTWQARASKALEVIAKL